nr:hypothetical protein [Candidatus Freyarchaeota archaeon]
MLSFVKMYGVISNCCAPPFRGPDGLWTKHGEPPLNDYQRFLEDPAKWWKQRINKTGFYRDFTETLSGKVDINK